MPQYRFSPYVRCIENHLIPNTVQYAIFHLLTGEMIVAGDMIRNLLRAGVSISLSDDDLGRPTHAQQRHLVLRQFLIPEGYDSLTPFVDQFITRPIQNPAIAYNSEGENWLLVRTSLAHYVFSPRSGELPPIVEEAMPSLAAAIFQLANGTRTLRDVLKSLTMTNNVDALKDSGLRAALDFLTDPDRQLIKFTPQTSGLDDPYQPFNTVPRSLYRISHSDSQMLSAAAESVVDFHRRGIVDACWEFDLIEPTVNHSLRFPSEVLGGLDYGARFCISTLTPEVLPVLRNTASLRVLEVGGGLGSFARSFLKQAALMRRGGIELSYHILEVSPVLTKSQRELLAELSPRVEHFQQDATKLALPGREFDLIIANEVIADFPTALVEGKRDESGERAAESTSAKYRKWGGDGAGYVEKYDLSDQGAPDSFLVNAGAFRFVERAWEHLAPGGTLILTEYGGESQYPLQAYHLNHEEFSIHFGHLKKCAEHVGFSCRLLGLNEFLKVDEHVSMLNGHEEHIMCLNYIFKRFGMSLPYFACSEQEFQSQFGALVERTRLTGLSFSPLRAGFHFGPKIEDFMVLIMNRPKEPGDFS